MPHKYKNQNYFLLLIVFVLLLSINFARAATAEEPHPGNLTAEEIIGRMAQVYATSESYSDQGVVRSVFVSIDGTRTIEKTFTTAFVRPDRFRFEYKEKRIGDRASKFIIYRSGNDVRTYWDLDKGMKQPESLGVAMSIGAGISSGSSRTIPTMLVPDESRFPNAILYYDPQRIEDKVFDGVDCFQISDPAEYRRLTLWIGKNGFSLRKIYREQEFDDFRLQETTTYKPTINGVVKDKMLEFNSPIGN